MGSRLRGFAWFAVRQEKAAPVSRGGLFETTGGAAYFFFAAALRFSSIAACAAASLAKATALADDSGLEVDALGGEPGVRSRRYAGDDASDADRIALVLSKLDGVPVGSRTARFRSVIALAEPGRLVGTGTGTVDGVIGDMARGTNGFGYDPIFWYPPFRCTTAQLPDADKAGVDRKKAVALMLAQPSMIKRPVLEAKGKLIVGFTPAAYGKLFG